MFVAVSLDPVTLAIFGDEDDGCGHTYERDNDALAADFFAAGKDPLMIAWIEIMTGCISEQTCGPSSAVRSAAGT